MTIGKIFSSPSKPDQAGISSFIFLEVTALYRQPSWRWFWSERRDKVIVAEIFYFMPNVLAPPSEIVVSHKKYVKQI